GPGAPPRHRGPSCRPGAPDHRAAGHQVSCLLGTCDHEAAADGYGLCFCHRLEEIYASWRRSPERDHERHDLEQDFERQAERRKADNARLVRWMAETPPPLGGGTHYGLAALQGLLAELAACEEGNRNNSLNRAAFRLGQLIASRDLDGSVAAD